MNQKVFIAKISDNQDPEKLGRVKITYESDNGTVSDWVPLITSEAGNESGMFSLPDIEDQVIVLETGNNIKKFCVLGSIWANDIKPPATEENNDADYNQDGNNSLHFIKSRAGNMIILDDTESKEKIQIISADSTSRLEFNTEEELIKLETENDIQFSAERSLLINAEEIEIKASKQINITTEEFQTKVSKEMQLNANKDITVKGSGISLN